MSEYELLEHGVITKRFFSFQYMTEYLNSNFRSVDPVYLLAHGVKTREVAPLAKPKI